MPNLETLADLQAHLDGIYGEVNKQLSCEEILVRLDEASGYLFHTIKRNQIAETEKWLVKTFSWLVAFSNQIGIDLQKELIGRYPKICPHCLDSPCICELTQKQPTRYSVNKREQELYIHADVVQTDISNRRTTPDLDEFAEILQNLYVANNLKWELNKALFLLQLSEERAEMIEAYRRFKVQKRSRAGEMHLKLVGKEAADFLAWLIACWVQLHVNPKGGYSIQDTVVSQFSLGCGFCHAIPCACPSEKRLGISTAERLGVSASAGDEVLVELQGELHQLIAEIRAIPTIAATADELREIDLIDTDSRTATKKFQNTLNKIKSLSSVGSDVSNIGFRLSKILEALDKLSV